MSRGKMYSIKLPKSNVTDCYIHTYSNKNMECFISSWSEILKTWVRDNVSRKEMYELLNRVRKNTTLKVKISKIA